MMCQCIYVEERFIIEQSQSSKTLQRLYGLFFVIGKCLPHVYSARLLGISTQPACLTCHPLILLITHSETGNSNIPAYAFALRLMATISCPSWLHVLCSIDSITYVVAATYFTLSILLLISQIRLALRLLTSEHYVTNVVFISPIRGHLILLITVYFNVFRITYLLESVYVEYRNNINDRRNVAHI